MASHSDRAAKRDKRRAGKRNNHEPLLRLVREEASRKHTAPQKLEITPLTAAQTRYDNSIHTNLVTFGIGPAGTGKTWWAAMRAAEALKKDEIKRIVITRPAVEAGESLGFLPGEMDEKFEPYFRPVRDALEEYFGTGELEYRIKAGDIEARPLAFLRGATLKNCWVILDEAQNVTPKQMKMFLTRIGQNARFIVNGDPGQKDIDGPCALADAERRLSSVNGVNFVRFGRGDIVRSGICQVITDAYENEEPSSDRYNDDTSSHEEDRTGLFAFLKVP